MTSPQSDVSNPTSNQDTELLKKLALLQKDMRDENCNSGWQEFCDEFDEVITTLIDSHKREVVEARLEEVRNAKVVQIDTTSKAEFDDWCFKRQDEIREGVPPKYEYEAPPQGFDTWQQFNAGVADAYNSQFKDKDS